MRIRLVAFTIAAPALEEAPDRSALRDEVLVELFGSAQFLWTLVDAVMPMPSQEHAYCRYNSVARRWQDCYPQDSYVATQMILNLVSRVQYLAVTLLESRKDANAPCRVTCESVAVYTRGADVATRTTHCLSIPGAKLNVSARCVAKLMIAGTSRAVKAKHLQWPKAGCRGHREERMTKELELTETTRSACLLKIKETIMRRGILVRVEDGGVVQTEEWSLRFQASLMHAEYAMRLWKERA